MGQSIRNAAEADQDAKLRNVEIYNKGEWKKGSWKGLMEGHIFRLREPGGDIADKGTDLEICIAVSNAVPRPKLMIYGVESEPFVHIDMGHLFASRIKVFAGGEQLWYVWNIDMRAGTLVREGVTEPFDYVEIGPKPGTEAYKAEQVEAFKKAPGHAPS